MCAGTQPTRLSLRHIEEGMAERGVLVDHATVHRWSIKIFPVLAAMFRRCKRPVGTQQFDRPKARASTAASQFDLLAF